MNKLAIGTAQFGLPYGVTNSNGKVSEEEAFQIIQSAKKAKVDTIDTAISYGESESLLGEIGVKDFKLVTKISIPDVISHEELEYFILDSIERSCQRLNIENLYGLLLHDVKQLDGSYQGAIVSAFEKLKEIGIVKKIGVSIYHPDCLIKVFDKLKPDIVQTPYNAFDQRIEKSGGLNFLKSLGVEVHARSAFLQGLLLLPYSDVPLKFKGKFDIFFKWKEYLDSENLEPLMACLSYPLCNKKIDRTVVGVANASQFSQILNVANGCAEEVIKTFEGSEELSLIDPSNWGEL